MTSKIAPLPTQRQQMETRFVELMTELFQLDEAEALDFGLYRIIRRHNREVRAFLGEIITDGASRALQGGRLAELLDATFETMGNEAQADDKFRIKDLEQQLGLKPGMTQDQREAALAQAESFPALKGLVAEYRSRTETLSSQQTVQQDRAEVLNRLYQFFSRHYQDGDFIVERRYGKGGARYVKSTGEDTEFHWATEDMYYIKSGDIFTDFPVRLANGQRVLFTVEPESLQATRAALKPNDKAHYSLDTATREADLIKVRLKYLKGVQSEKQKDEIVIAVQKAGSSGTVENSVDIRRWLNRFIARNQSDFFIHKRLKEALNEDLDIFIKTEVLDIDQLLAGTSLQTDLPKRAMKVAQIMHVVGRQIIDFLAALEDFQKALWEKKKLVLETRYIISLDRLERYAPGWLKQNIVTIIDNQRQEWRELGLGDYANAAACIRHADGDLASSVTEHYFPLPVDTQNFDASFKWSMLEAVTVEMSLDEALDGVAIQSDNWQALNTVQVKYRERVKCIYIDPPYNTDTSGIPYKNGYFHSSWNALMHDRLGYLKGLLRNDGALFVSIDKQERTNLERVLDNVFGSDNHIEELIWTQSTVNSQLPNYATNHEYVEVYAKHRASVENAPEMFREPKPGYSEIMELIEQLSPDYPASHEVESALKSLMQQHQIDFRDELHAIGLEYDRETKKRDLWKGIYEYKYIEYRDSNGILVPDELARSTNARIIVWQSISIAAPASKQAASTRDPNHSNYRFYRPKHPVTGKPCPHPKGGWKFPQLPDPENAERVSFEAHQKDQRIHWGKDEKTVPRLKSFLHEVEMNIGKSVFHDYADGERQVADMFGRSGIFLSPKHTRFVKRFVRQASKKSDWIVDIFGGSGSSPHAVLEANAEDFTRRRFLVVETNDYIQTLIIPRLKKGGAATVWAQGKTKVLNGSGIFIRVQALEQYDDTLESLDTEISEGDSAELLFQDPAFALRYRLEESSRSLYCGVDRFTSPFGYQLKRADGGGEARPYEVDLVESVPYLLGMDVNRLYREKQGVVMLGRNQRGQSVSVFFRECATENSAQWVAAKLAEHPADRVFTNDPAGLSFEGCDSLEAIESVFALQFGRP